MTEIGTCEGNNSEESRVGRVSVILAARWPRPPDKCGKEGAKADVWYGKGNVTQASP